jgi:hypothetical protein
MPNLTAKADSGPLQQWVERILNTEALELAAIETQASFEAEQEIREGWLVPKNKRGEK